MYDARVLYFSLVRHFEDGGISQFLFIGTQGADEVAQPFGQHRNGAVYEINGCRPFLRFFIDDAAFRYIMCHVGNVHAHFPQVVLQFADGQGIVKVFGVFGVYGKGGYIAEIFTFGILLRGNFGGNLVRGFFHGCGIDIRQPEFGQDGVHLGGVVSGFSQDVNDLTDGVFSLIRPFHYLDDGFVACFSTFQFLFGDEDVVGQRTVFRDKESVGFGNFQCSYEGIVGAFQYFDDFAFGFTSAAFGIKGDAYFVACHGVCRVAFGHENGVTATFGDE